MQLMATGLNYCHTKKKCKKENQTFTKGFKNTGTHHSEKSQIFNTMEHQGQ